MEVLTAKTHEECPTSLIPTGYKLVILLEESEEHAIKKKDSMIVLPEEVESSYAAASQRGKLLAIGPLAWKACRGGDGSPWAEIGDYVWLKKYSGINKKIDGKQYRFVEDVEIIGIDRSKD